MSEEPGSREELPEEGAETPSPEPPPHGQPEKPPAEDESEKSAIEPGQAGEPERPSETRGPPDQPPAKPETLIIDIEDLEEQESQPDSSQNEPPEPGEPAARLEREALVVDLDEEPEEPSRPGTLVLDVEDLPEVPPEPPGTKPVPTAGIPPPSPYAAPGVSGYGPAAVGPPPGMYPPAIPRAPRPPAKIWIWLSSTLVSTTLGGLLGGILAWLPSEIWIIFSPFSQVRLSGRLPDAAIYFALAGSVVAMMLNAAEGIFCRVWELTWRRGSVGLLMGLGAGFLGGLIAELVFGVFNLTWWLGALPRVLLRSVGWSIFGLSFGICQGIYTNAVEKVRNAVIGGAAGGFVGGMLFDLIAASGSGLSRFTGLVVMGACIGIALGLIETVLRDAWLKVVRGPLTGKEFNIYTELTVIGSSPKSEVVLMKDPAVAPQHAQITVESNRYVLEDLGSGYETLVNEQRITRRVLVAGDEISVGNSILVFNEREK